MKDLIIFELPKYEKPVIMKQEVMVFPQKIIETTLNGGTICHQCSSCHGCR